MKLYHRTLNPLGLAEHGFVDTATLTDPAFTGVCFTGEPLSMSESLVLTAGIEAWTLISVELPDRIIVAHRKRRLLVCDRPVLVIPAEVANRLALLPWIEHDDWTGWTRTEIEEAIACRRHSDNAGEADRLELHLLFLEQFNLLAPDAVAVETMSTGFVETQGS